MNKGGQKTGLQRGDRTRFPYEPRVIGGKLVMPAELRRIDRMILDAVEVEIISDEMRAVVESGMAGASAQAAAEEPARITPPACFSTSIRLARSSVPAQPGENVFFARMQAAGSLCRNLTATGHHSALSWVGESPCEELHPSDRATAHQKC